MTRWKTRFAPHLTWALLLAVAVANATTDFGLNWGW
jgi:hypothetical protein